MKLDQDDLIVFRLTSHNHAVGLYFDAYSGKFRFLDSNQMSGRNTYYIEADPKELPDIIFNSFPPETLETYSPFSITAFSRTQHPELIQRLKAMTQEMLLSEERYNRKNSINTTALLLLCQQGDIELVRFLLDNQPVENLNFSKNNVDNLIFRANHCGHHEIVKLISEHEIYGSALFSQACQDGNMQIFNIMLPHVAKININRPDKNGNIPLLLACQNGHSEIVKLLLHYIIITGKNLQDNIDARDKNGNTSLSFACQNHHKEIVKLLIENGANQSSLPTSAVACQKGDIEIINLLLQLGENKFSLFFTACKVGNTFTIEYLLHHLSNEKINALDTEGNTSLLIAYQYGHTDIIKLLIKQGANPLALFSHACQDSNIEIIELLLSFDLDKHALFSLACQEGNLTSISFLLNHMNKENIYTPDTNNRTPILVAYEHGHLDIVRFLIQVCTNKTHNDHSILYTSCENGLFEVVAMLLKFEKDHDINLRTNTEKTTLFFTACKNGHAKVAQLLLQHNKMQSISTRDVNGKTPFFIACESGKTETVLLLLNDTRMQETNAIDINGNTPLLVACQNGHLEIVKILLQHGAMKNIHHQNKFYETPLYAACRQGNFDIVQLLLQHGANKYINMPNAEGYSPFLIAEQNGYPKIVALLKEKMLPGAQETVKLFTKKEKKQPIFVQENNLHLPLFDKKRKAANSLTEQPPCKKQNTADRMEIERLYK